ncbi:MOB kinase activator-like 2 isoform X2 [Lucilia cuprina]|uniref:MOB kinase activator-like 2 isoform X2 n=1 Tax=Lucilia cuprina TaxID=7375 RepID=UPI001F05563E|nr:MOB kinase activator-like 2 isoform X2 [Lucilia cuprina]
MCFCCCPGILFNLSTSSSANTCLASNNSSPLSSPVTSTTFTNTISDTNVLNCEHIFMGGVLSLFSSAPAVANSTNVLHKNCNNPNHNNNNNNNNNNSSAATTITTSDVSSSSNVSQMRQSILQTPLATTQKQQQQNIYTKNQQQQKQQFHHGSSNNNRRHQSLTSYMLFNGFHIKARRKERDGDQNSTDTKLYLEESVLERKLPEADLKALVDLPAGLDYNEWLASHTLALFEHVNLVYGTISEFCTTSGCPDMTGPGNRTYLWFDEKGKKTRVAAPQYIDYVMTFTQKTVSDESIFPTKYANEFPSSFESIARKILRLQFHVIAHLYAAHFREIALLGLHTHLNLTFAHLTALHRRFNLIDEKETDVLRDLEVALRLTDDTTGGGSGGTGSGSSQNDATETNSSSSGGGSGGGGGGGGGSGVDSIKGSLNEDVNSVQHNNLMDCNTTAQPPICTQPEANLKSQQFGGGGGLIGGILGDLSSGEFGDTMHYCTSAVPASSTTNNTSSNHTSTPNTCSTNSTCTTADQHSSSSSSTVGAVTANGNNGAGALNFHLNNNNHLAHHPHTHHPHHHHHHHHHNNVHHHHNHPYAQNTGLIQCNASNAPTATNATTSTTTA